MTTLSLRYGPATTGPWTSVPDLTSAFPTVPVGALPVQSVTITSEPQEVTPFGCGCDGWLPVPGGSGDDAYLILRVTCPPIPLSLEAGLITFFINYKAASSHEAKYDRYGQGGYVSAPISLIEAKERHGMLHLTFRLAAAMADALANV
ncbi:MAG: hypothetical protein ACYDBH_23380 [Acidobacteriaceae bacterium]